MAKRFNVPFATTGDKTTIPDVVQPDGSVSYEQGFGYDYEREYADPQAKDIARETINQVLHDITDAIGEIQKNGVAPFDVASKPYPKGAAVSFDGELYVSAISDNNNDIPHASWRLVPTDIPAATETAAGTLRIATQAETDAGDADDCAVTPKKLRGALDASALGRGQTWQDVTASRALDTTYTNTTGRTIVVIATSNSSTGTGVYRGFVDDEEVHFNTLNTTSSGSNNGSITLIVPPGSTYKVTFNRSLLKWTELR